LGRLRFVEGWPRHPEVHGNFADQLAIHLVAADHLVAHLDKVGGVEERIVGEQCVANRFGTGVECAIASQRGRLTIPGLCLGHGAPRCV
jgi:hypothetical protein